MKGKEERDGKGRRKDNIAKEEVDEGKKEMRAGRERGRKEYITGKRKAKGRETSRRGNKN